MSTTLENTIMKNAIIFLVFIFAIFYNESSYAIQTSAISGADSMIVISRVMPGTFSSLERNSISFIHYTFTSNQSISGEQNILNVENNKQEKNRIDFTSENSSCFRYSRLKQKPNRPIQI